MKKTSAKFKLPVMALIAALIFSMLPAAAADTAPVGAAEAAHPFLLRLSGNEDGSQGTVLKLVKNQVNGKYLSLKASVSSAGKISSASFSSLDLTTGLPVTIDAVFEETELRAIAKLIAEEGSFPELSEDDLLVFLVSGFNNFAVNSNGDLSVCIQSDISGERLILSFASSDIAETAELIRQLDEQEACKRVIDPEKKVIALTFDDGPSKYTAQIVEILTQYNSAATFFVVGNRVGSYPEAVKAVAESNCEFGNHTWNHAALTKCDADTISSLIDQTQNAVYDIAGIYPKYVRPPYGYYNSFVLETLPLPAVCWNIDPQDWVKGATSEAVAQSVIDHAKDGGIILMHDLYQTTMEAVPLVCQGLIDLGYQIVNVTELFEARETEALAHHVYRGA